MHLGRGIWGKILSIHNLLCWKFAAVYQKIWQLSVPVLFLSLDSADGCDKKLLLQKVLLKLE